MYDKLKYFCDSENPMLRFVAWLGGSKWLIMNQMIQHIQRLRVCVCT